MGGLPRRATVIEEQRSAGVPLVVVDAGDLFWKGPRIGDDAAPQQKLKAEGQAASYALMGIDAMVPGEGDFVFGLDWLRETASRHKLPYLAANLSCGESNPFERGRIIERNGLRIAVVGVLDSELDLPGCSTSEPAVAVRETFTALGPADVRLVLSHQRTDQDRALASAVDEVDLVVNGHARLTNTAVRDLPGGALQLAAGSRGKHVGVATIELVPGSVGFRGGDTVAETATRLDQARVRLEAVQAKVATSEGKALERVQKQIEHYTSAIATLETELAVATEAQKFPANRLDNKLVGLDAKIADHPGTTAILAGLKDAVAAAEGSGAAPSGPLNYVGAESCKSCHPAPYAQWQGTPHATAYASLQNVNRHLDRECYACHATGVNQPGGPNSPAEVGVLGNVQCESCHGPGRAHVDAPAAGQMLPTPPTELCIDCHDGERDEGRFEAERYLRQVVHLDASPAPGATK